MSYWLATSCPTTRLICITPEASAAGRAMTIIARMSGVQRGREGRRGKPAWAAARHVRASCATPATGIDQINQSATSPPVSAAKVMAAMTKMFSSTGAAAATAKRPVAFRMPENSAESDMHRI